MQASILTPPWSRTVFVRHILIRTDRMRGPQSTSATRIPEVTSAVRISRFCATASIVAASSCWSSARSIWPIARARISIRSG